MDKESLAVIFKSLDFIANTILLGYINNRINKEVCNDTINKLTDVYLINDYTKCKSVQGEMKILESILEEEGIDSSKKKSIINKYILKLIPAGTKGVIRGNKFNSIVKDTINNLNLDTKRFEICFEKQCPNQNTSEIPDWYILEKSTGKVIIGMNQLDLWGGGQQINRGSKYLINNKNNTDKSKLLCVVCNQTKLKSYKNKVFNLFRIGFLNNTLCYLKNIKCIVNEFFNSY